MQSIRASPLRGPARPRARCRCHAAHEAGRSLFVFGLGYSTLGLIRQAEAAGGWAHITSTSRRPERLQQLETPAHTVARYDPAAGVELDAPAAAALSRASHVLTSIPPAGLPLYDPVTRAQLRALRARARAAAAGDAPPLDWLGVLSSTSVYGDHGGGWVDESTPPATASSRGIPRLEHERSWEALARELSLPLHIFRLAGIYGPGRSVLTSVQSAAAGGDGPSAGQRRRGRQRFISRVHAADIAATLLASMEEPGPDPLGARLLAAGGGGGGGGSGSGGAAAGGAAPDRASGAAATITSSSSGEPLGSGGGGGGEGGGGAAGGGFVAVFNVADDDPAPRDEVEAFARQLLGLPAAERPAEPDGGDGGDGGGGRAGGRGLEEKRVWNEGIKRRLGVALQFPTYREGLAAIAAGDARPFLGPADWRAIGGRGAEAGG
ncbi:hypothetical protein Rsub_05060 [Raphidocelis subcapitata]|uniref:NAD-dependent epimerase/dehydratase domain-containing protein n=1 Tax=Raphidocelis subcapitata TaxID=307507 RepID=A0A2V0NYH5_9CHLO|nr:hypothetical protein Rsub_05060 [Raphidocelis subcapitata]|eukprot:GBF92691.1 hypothetical protein Rsub_05060 [Raphidocelis subcapitata]